MQNFSLHTHTLGFDGKDSEEAMLEQAEKLGLGKIGFSNHFIVHPSIKRAPMFMHAQKGGYDAIYSADFEEAVAKFASHYAKIDYLRKHSDITVLKGMEVDYFPSPEWCQGFAKALAVLKPDYLIGSAHFVEYDNTLYNSHDIKAAPEIERNKLLHRYWQNVRAAAESKMFDFMAHLDLMKKVGLSQEPQWFDDELQTVKAIKNSGVIVELNTSGFKFDDNAPYPSQRIMQMLAAHNVPVLISDDAHKKENLTFGFAKAEKIARECGITNFILSPKLQNKYAQFSLLAGHSDIGR